MNDQFVANLHDRFNTESTWQDVEPRTRILHMPIQDLAAEGGYDAIVSGLPLNNFSGELVEQLLQTLVGLLAPRRNAIVFRIRRGAPG